MQEAVELIFKLEYDPERGWLEEKRRAQIKKVLGYIQSNSFTDYSYCQAWYPEEREHYPCIVAKKVEETFHLMHMFVWDSNVETSEFWVCNSPHCYNEVLGSSLDALLFDEYGEACHEIHEHCAQHVSEQSRLIRKNIETITEEPGEYWTKIHVWQIDDKWYSQKVWIESESRELTSPLLYEVAAMWQGPCETRELAIKAARESEKE